MGQEHEYAVLGGLNRALIGRYLGIAAASISAAIVFVLLLLVDVAKRFGWAHDLPPIVLSTFGAGVVYAALYWLFNRHVWKFPLLSGILKVPDLSGEWICQGQTINLDKTLSYKWSGEVTIIQRWDKLRIRLKTSQSGSNSVFAALIHDEADGYRLMYSYVNEPKIGETDLKAHRGFADFTFAKDLTRADGEYFNGHGRFTFGTMILTRKST
jgi:hypothetical protein